MAQDTCRVLPRVMGYLMPVYASVAFTKAAGRSTPNASLTSPSTVTMLRAGMMRSSS